jgi:hypothetical protein
MHRVDAMASFIQRCRDLATRQAGLASRSDIAGDWLYLSGTAFAFFASGLEIADTWSSSFSKLTA